MSKIAKAMQERRGLLTASLLGVGALLSAPSHAAQRRTLFNRVAYDRYVRLMNSSDPRVIDYYAADIKFVMGIRGRDEVAKFHAHQRPYVRETLEVQFFCSDLNGAAAEVRSTLRCIKDCEDSSVFGRALKAGEVQRTHGFLFYKLNDNGLITEILGPPPEVLQPWRLETS
jgi:hypothetical protein